MTVVLLKTPVFWDVMLCCWTGRYLCFQDCNTFIFRAKQSKNSLSV